MSVPSTAREALIIEALGEAAKLLDRIELLTSAMELNRESLSNASSELEERLKAFESSVTAVTQRVQASAVEHIIKRTAKAANDSIEVQAKAMNTAARLAFSAQADTTLARVTTSLQLVVHRIGRPWEHWLTHAATASVSAALTWWLVSSCSFR